MKIAPTFIYRHIRLSDITLRPQFKINVKEKGKVNDNTAKMQSTNQLGV